MKEDIIWEEEHSRFSLLTEVERASAEFQTRPILSVVAFGTQSKATLEPIFDRLVPHLESNAPALFLNDVSQLGDINLATKWYAAARIKENRPFIERSAVFGASPTLIVAAGAILRAAGRTDIRLFPGKDAAIDWLLEITPATK